MKPTCKIFSNSIFIDTIDSEQNLSSIKELISINILTKPHIVENIHVGKSCSPSEVDIYRAPFREFRDIFAWSYEEMLGIDSSIVEHEIKMYHDVKPVRQGLRPIHENKVVSIKVEVQKLFHASFIYIVLVND